MATVIRKAKALLKRAFGPKRKEVKYDSFTVIQWIDKFPTIGPCYNHLMDCVRAMERTFDYCSANFEGKEITDDSMHDLAMLTRGIKHMGKRLDLARDAHRHLEEFLLNAMEKNNMFWEKEE